jgi:hypothetical protein
MATECRVHKLNLGLLIHFPHPLVCASDLQVVMDLVTNLGKRPHGDFLGAEQTSPCFSANTAERNALGILSL